MTTTRTATATAALSDTRNIGDMRAQVARMDEEVRELVKERPILALLGAIAAGYLIGRVLRRIA